MLRALSWSAAVLTCLAGVPAVAGATALATVLYYPVPPKLPPPVQSSFGSQPSIVYDSTGQVIGQFTAAGGSNLPVPYSEIPQVVKDAVIASEDKNFFHEPAISAKGIVRAAYEDLLSEKPEQGGSTITEQYAKDLYTHDTLTLARKVKEALTARMIAKRLTKQQILYRYLSISYFGQGAYGVGAAAETYFREPVSELDASQAAMLAGVLPAPSLYDPLVNLQAAEERRETVLSLMRQQGYLTRAQYRQAMAAKLAVAGGLAPPAAGATLVYPPQQVKNRYPYFLDYVRQYMEEKVGAYELYHGGLRIYTTLNPKDQAAAEAAVQAQLAGTKPPLQMALASIQPSTGYVVALVGGRGYDVSEVDMALSGCPQPAPPPTKLIMASTCQEHPGSVVLAAGSGRLAGSTFKPFTLATALTDGISPNAVYNGPPTYDVPGCGGVCVIHNAGGESGTFTLTTATWYSIDTVYVQVLKQVGIKAVAEMAKRLGVWTAYDESDFGLSYTLGTNPVNPLEMASAYATFADQGVHVDPSPVVKAVDSQGRIVYDDTHPKGRRVLSSYVADTINSILQGVVQHGTGYPNALIGRPAAGKTGTANGPTDAWFVGYTPQLSAAVWMGYSNNETTPMLDVKGVQVYGATYPAAAWHDYMVAALAGVPPEPFPAPSQAPPAPAPTLRPGPSMSPAAPPSGPYVAPAPPPPTAVAPYFEPTTSVPASGPSPTSQPAPVSSPGPTGSTASTSPPGSASPSGSTGSSTSAPGR